MRFIIKRRDGVGETQTVDGESLNDACETLSCGGCYLLDVAPAPAPAPAPIVNSTFESTVHDASAAARIGAQHAALIAGGIPVNADEQLFATGTRMADDGYRTQAKRQREHDAQQDAREAIGALVGAVQSEGRFDRVLSAAEIAQGVESNGSIKVRGYAMGIQAIRGLVAHLESPALGYTLGVIERMAGRKASGMTPDEVRKANDADRAKIAEVLKHECLQNPGEVVKLRLRERGVNGRPDCYATVGEGYSPADAPDACEQLSAQLPRDAKASWAYDPATTRWELRASVWTPTPVAEQAVGEAFQGYVSFSSADNGTAKFRGGGGVVLLRCLNASTYSADDSDIAKIHRGRILIEVDRMLARSLRAIDVLTTAWGTNRRTAIEVPTGVTLEDAIPGLYMSLLRDKGSALVGVLPGRTKDHAAGLARAFHAERRDASQLVRSDLAQGWTRYIQDQPAYVRRDAEQAIGDWLVSGKEIKVSQLTA